MTLTSTHSCLEQPWKTIANYGGEAKGKGNTSPDLSRKGAPGSASAHFRILASQYQCKTARNKTGDILQQLGKPFSLAFSLLVFCRDPHRTATHNIHIQHSTHANSITNCSTKRPAMVGRNAFRPKEMSEVCALEMTTFGSDSRTIVFTLLQLPEFLQRS